MRILFLAKRRPQQRDLVERPYGRFFHLPSGLAACGHTVRVALLDHRRTQPVSIQRDGVDWDASDILRMGAIGCWQELQRITSTLRPDWIIGCSDLYYGILAVKLARRFGARVAIDAYDNFESYMQWAVPLHWMWRQALAKADLVTAAGPQLAELMQQHRGREVHVLPMAADPQFAPDDRRAARERLQLPHDAPLLGHCGSFTATRGSRVLVDAFTAARAKIPALRLVMTGRYPREIEQVPGVLGLGLVADELMPSVLNALDVVAVLLAETAFGRYSYPAKLYEAMACGIPVVASATKPAQWILDNQPAHLARVGDAGDLCGKILQQLGRPMAAYPPLQSWPQLAESLEALLSRG
jgi:glycosyltransferase involved in cell wall biosynthesis